MRLLNLTCLSCLSDASSCLIRSLSSNQPQALSLLQSANAIRILEEDSSATVIERRSVIRGFELYLVEQWACSRQSPVIIVTTYTGDDKHFISVGVVCIPQDESRWSPRIRLFFKAASQYNARPMETDLGELMVTNLSSFPSSLTVIAIPDGDVRRHRQQFIVNEDLKRLGCSGRSGLGLTDPTEATRTKFQQLYKTSDRIPVQNAVTELIKLCQVALYMFEKLEHQYIDGLLCDVTETAINNWWTEVGSEHYNFEPNDGILGPSTVTALLGMLMGARNRLHWFGAPVSKDVFDIESTKRGIYYFQKQQKLERTRKLDRQTLFKLHTATAKGAAGEGWGVQKAVKSTMTEIGGKRGEIVMDMVSGKDKGGLADIETLDMDRFIGLVYGDRPKWLWRGKPRRSTAENMRGDQDIGGAVLGKIDTTSGDSKRVQSLPIEAELERRVKDESPTGPYSAGAPGSSTNIADSVGDRDALRRGVFKSVAGKMNDARSGLGRIKDAVGGSRRGHISRPSLSTRDDYPESANGSAVFAQSPPGTAMSPGQAGVSRAFTWKNKPEEYMAALRRGETDVLPHNGDLYQNIEDDSRELRLEDKSGDELTAVDTETALSQIGSEVRKDVTQQSRDLSESAVNETDLEGPVLEMERKSGGRARIIARRHSCGLADLNCSTATNESRWPRRLSFGDAEEAVLGWKEIVDITEAASYATCVEAHAEAASHLNRYIEGIVLDVGPWVEEKLRAVEQLNERYGRDKAELQTLYHQLNDACQRVRYSSDELLSEQRENLSGSVNEVEMLLARLEYEINGLEQKVHDVEEGIQNFERQVERVESRAEELKVQLETESWLHWFVRTLTGVGTGPNITREK